MKNVIFILIFLLGIFESGICNAQNEFRLICYGEISVRENEQFKTVKPYGEYEIYFKLTNNGLSINCPIIGEMTITDGEIMEYKVRDIMNYTIKSKNYSFYIAKHKETSSSNMFKILLGFRENDEYYHMKNATVLFYLPNNQTEFADQALHACTIDEDKLIKFMKSLSADN